MADAPITRPSNIDKWPLAGRYWYTDQPGTEPVAVRISVVEGRDLVHFEDDEQTQVYLKELPGCDTPDGWREHFVRA